MKGLWAKGVGRADGTTQKFLGESLPRGVVSMQHISSLPAEIEKYLETLKIGQGRYAGQDLVVLPWQSEFLRGAFSQGGRAWSAVAGGAAPIVGCWKDYARPSPGGSRPAKGHGLGRPQY